MQELAESDADGSEHMAPDWTADSLWHAYSSADSADQSERVAKRRPANHRHWTDIRASVVIVPHIHRERHVALENKNKFAANFSFTLLFKNLMSELSMF